MNRLMTAATAALLLSASAAVADEVTFSLDARQWGDKPQAVGVAGDFNGWSTDADALKDDDGDQVWTATLDLDEGVHHYKFVIDGDRWIADPAADPTLAIDDTYGGTNSGLIVGSDARDLPPPRPNAIDRDAVLHDPSDAKDASADAAGRVRLRVRAQAGDVQSAEVVPAGGGAAAPMHKLEQERGYDVFGAIADLGPSGGYSVVLRDGTDRLVLDRGGKPFAVPAPALETPDWAKRAEWYQIFAERFRNGDPANDPHDGPDQRLVPWNGGWNDTLPGEAAGAQNFYEGQGNVWKRRYGGDLQGVRQELPYLRSLGVTAIYLNPVFEAESMHKYDTADFRHVDDNFSVVGDLAEVQARETDDPATWEFTDGDRMFLDFVAEAHRQGFKVVLDGVFNHVGTAHPFFQDVVKNGAKSKYADWFEITSFPDALPADPAMIGKPGGLNYKAWDRPSGALPVFRKDPTTGLAPGPYAHVMAVTKRWLDPDGDPATDDGIDGWRLDVPGDIPHPFWEDWRKVVKRAKPDAYVTGEIWSMAGAWLQGDEFDAVMNYQFAMAAQSFLVNETSATTPTAFAGRLAELVYAYPLPVVLAQMNLFDSHDTDRLASMFVNPDRPYDGANRPQDNAKEFAGPAYSTREPDAVERMKQMQAVAVQHAYVGAPMTYYGDEAGMWSADDPSNRQPFPWADRGPYPDGVKFDQGVFDAYQRIIAVRAALPALQAGDFWPVVTDDAGGVLAFARSLGDQTAYCVVNRSGASASVALPLADGDGSAVLLDYLDPQQAEVVDRSKDDPDGRPTVVPVAGGQGYEVKDGKVTLSLPAHGAMILAAPLRVPE